jgi:hypothetical protein
VKTKASIRSTAGFAAAVWVISPSSSNNMKCTFFTGGKFLSMSSVAVRVRVYTHTSYHMTWYHSINHFN